MTKATDMSNNNAPYKKILYSADEVEAKINQLAADIVKRYDPGQTLFVGLLNGGLPFLTKLMFAIAKQDESFHPNAQFMIVSRYDEENKPRALRLVTDLPEKYRDLTGKTVVVIDDLIDEGDTLEFALEHLKSYGAKKVDPVVLVKKEKGAKTTAGRPIHTAVTYGFIAPDVWLTGMGMDDSRLRRATGESIEGEGNRWANWIAEAQ